MNEEENIPAENPKSELSYSNKEELKHFPEDSHAPQQPQTANHQL